MKILNTGQFSRDRVTIPFILSSSPTLATMSFRGGHRRNNNNRSNADSSFDDNPLRSRINSNNDNANIEIRNWQGGSRDDLVSFIHRKAQIRLQNVRVSGSVLHATVRPDEVSVIRKYSGIKFAGGSLDIQTPNTGLSSNTQNTIQLLETYLMNHYSPEQQLLSLENLRNDPFLLENGLLASSSTTSKMFPALMKVSYSKIPTVESVSLANNNLTDIVSVTTLAATYPKLKNLSLANNSIARSKGLENWRQKFPHLRELILSGNPITSTPTYKADMIKLFPKLIMLDGQVVQDASQVESPHLPFPVKQNFFENPEVQNIAGGFLTSFFDFYDRDRSQLLPLYDNQSTFSLNVNPIVPRSMNVSAPTGWGSSISLSRNLSKITTVTARVNRLFIGPGPISTAFQKLAATQHDLKSPEKFSLDVWTVRDIRTPGDQGIMISVHGEFLDGPQRWKRSFDRSLILVPGPTGNMIVASDMLTIRPYGGDDAWKESPPQQQQPANAPVSNQPVAGGIPPAVQALSPDQQILVNNLMQETRLKVEFALMCLQQAQFNYPQALELFNQSKASNSIPPDAFM